MKAVYCPYCGGRTKRNGRTSSGSQRWRCTACGASTTVRYDDTATRLDEFLGWLLSKDSQAAMPGGGRSFRRRTAEFWEVWPMPSPTASCTACSTSTGSGSRATSSCSYAAAARGWSPGTWRGRRTRGVVGPHVADPGAEVVVTDGGSGFAKAVRETWPRTRVQRCTFHAFSQVKRYTTTRPKLQAGRELYLIARDLMGIETLHQAELWVERYLDWCGFWADFLEDRTVVDGRRVYTHERLRRRARRCRRWCRRGRCSPTSTPPWPSRPAAVDQQHDRGRGELAAEGRPAQPPGLTSVKRVKAVFWWCHAHSGDARTAREKLAAMPTDADIDFLFSVCSASRRARTEGRSGATGPCGRTSTTGTVPVLAGLMDRNGCSIGTHILSYKPNIGRESAALIESSLLSAALVPGRASI